jgi:hypothetical protein
MTGGRIKQELFYISIGIEPEWKAEALSETKGGMTQGKSSPEFYWDLAFDRIRETRAAETGCS